MVIEAGDRFRLETSNDDVFAVVGVSIYRISRNTFVRVLGVKEGQLDVREVDLKLIESLWDQSDAHLERTPSSLEEAIRGRHLAKVVAPGKGALSLISESASPSKV